MSGDMSIRQTVQPQIGALPQASNAPQTVQVGGRTFVRSESTKEMKIIEKRELKDQIKSMGKDLKNIKATLPEIDRQAKLGAGERSITQLQTKLTMYKTQLASAKEFKINSSKVKSLEKAVGKITEELTKSAATQKVTAKAVAKAAFQDIYKASAKKMREVGLTAPTSKAVEASLKNIEELATTEQTFVSNLQKSLKFWKEYSSAFPNDELAKSFKESYQNITPLGEKISLELSLIHQGLQEGKVTPQEAKTRYFTLFTGDNFAKYKQLMLNVATDLYPKLQELKAKKNDPFTKAMKVYAKPPDKMTAKDYAKMTVEEKQLYIQLATDTTYLPKTGKRDLATAINDNLEPILVAQRLPRYGMFFESKEGNVGGLFTPDEAQTLKQFFRD